MIALGLLRQRNEDQLETRALLVPWHSTLVTSRNQAANAADPTRQAGRHHPMASLRRRWHFLYPNWRCYSTTHAVGALFSDKLLTRRKRRTRSSEKVLDYLLCAIRRY